MKEMICLDHAREREGFQSDCKTLVTGKGGCAVGQDPLTLENKLESHSLTTACLGRTEVVGLLRLFLAKYDFKVQ